MADKDIQMTQRNAANDAWDNLFPKSKAANITIVDTAGHFTGSDVEEVLAELFTFANDGKTGEANVIGSPALATDSFATLNGFIQTDKNTLAANLTAKGLASVGTEALADLVAKIANISTGKKWASGDYTITSTTTTFKHVKASSVIDSRYIEVTGLDFTPSLIFGIYYSGPTSEFVLYNNYKHFAYDSGDGHTIDNRTYYNSSTTGYMNDGYVWDSNYGIIVENGHFRLPTRLSAGEIINWYAFE